MVRLVREAEDATGKPLAVLVDLPGPKVRLSTVGPDPFTFRPGSGSSSDPRARRTSAAPPPRIRACRQTSRRATASCSPTGRSS